MESTPAERRAEEIEQGLWLRRGQGDPNSAALRVATTCNRSREQTNRITPPPLSSVCRHILPEWRRASRDRSIYFIERVLLFSKDPETGRSPPSPPVVSSLHREIFSTRVYKYSQGWRSRLILDRGRTRGRRARGKKQRGSRSPCKKNQLSRDERRI